MKVVTAATALMVYGESRRFATRVVAGADANRIILVGGGDPLLTRGQLAELAQRTAKTMRRSQVTSAVVDVDDYLFPQPSDAPGWAPGDRPTYAAAVRPLALFLVTLLLSLGRIHPRCRLGRLVLSLCY